MSPKYLIFLAFSIWINHCICDISVIKVVITVNLDYLPENEKLKIYNGNISVTNCSNFQNGTDGIYLTLRKNLTYQICDCTGVTFEIFPYYTNITTALITVGNSGLENNRILLNSTKNLVLLTSTNEYLSFVIWNDTFSPYAGVDQQEKLKELNPYSACSRNSLSQCLTYIEFGRNIIKYEFQNRIYYSSEIFVKNSSLEAKPKTNLNCKHGGMLKEKKCICQNTEDFIQRGPECESLQMALFQRQYLYVLPNSPSLTIEFSLFAPSFQKSLEILTINKENKNFLQYRVLEKQMSLKVKDIYINHSISIDTPNTWINIAININKYAITHQMNGISTTTEYHLAEYYFFLDRIPLIIYNNPKPYDKQMCISNLKVNGQIVDLYLPFYKNCLPNCGDCNNNQTCEYLPFKSQGSVSCTCKIGFKSSTNSGCEPDDTRTVNMPDESTTTVNISDKVGAISIIQFQFRTFSLNGNLITLNFSSPIKCNSTVKILNSNLFTSITWNDTTKSDTISTYNVSDGEWHIVNYRLTDSFLEETLDENLPFNSILIRFTTEFLFKQQFKLYNADLGPLEKSKTNKFARTSCFDTFNLIDKNFKTEYPEMNSSTTQFKCNGISCPNITCGNDSKCEEKWQNPTCVCIDKFVDMNGKCTFYKCINPYPCQNGGSCVKGENNDYKCICGETFQGKNCESNVSAAGFLWWIIVLVLLILLIIIIVILIYCCCCKKRKEPESGPDINKLHENAVFYNDSAGETDYVGPPINFDLMKYPPTSNKVPTPLYPNEELKERKMILESNNKDMIIDHPLEYGYEGVNSDAGSISSFGSRSTDNELNIQPIEANNEKFKYLKNLYK